MRKILEQKEAKFACGCGFIRGSPGCHRFYNLCVGSDAIPPGATVEVISTGLLAIGIICTVPIMAAGKSWYCGKKHPFIIRADNVRSHTMTITSLDGYRWLKNDLFAETFNRMKNYG